VAIADFALTAVPVEQQSDGVTRYRIGVIVVETATAFSFDEIIKLAGLKREGIVREEDFAHASDQIRRGYLDRGYLQVSVSIDRLESHRMQSPSLPSIDLVIRIKEGVVFAVRRLEFVGNQNTRDRIIRRQVRLEEGRPYRQRLVDESLIRINRLGLFEKLTMENVRLELDEREQFVDVLIRFNEKSRRSQTKAVSP
jgi:outer membrane protein insertion porin family